MNPNSAFIQDEIADLADGVEQADKTREEDLWFLSGPMAEEPDFLPLGHRVESAEATILADWMQAESG